MAQHKFVLPLLALILATSVHAATKQKTAPLAPLNASTTADRLIVKRNYKAAFEVLLTAAKAGNAKAMVKLANAYRYGLGTQRDESSAMEWYRKSASAGNKEAALSLQRQQIAVPVTLKKLALKSDGLGAANMVDFAHLPDRPKGAPDWIDIAAAQKNHGALKVLNAEAAGNVQLIQAKLGDVAGLNVSRTTNAMKDDLGRSALMVAIANNKPEAIPAILSTKPDFAVTDKQGFTAAGLAARACDSARLDQLAAAGDDLGGGKVPPLVLATVTCEEWNALKASFAMVNVNGIDDQGRTAAFYAAAKGKVAVLGWLADKKADLGAADNAGLTPLHAAAQFNQGMAFRFLLSKIGNADFVSSRGVTPLMLAAYSGCDDCITAIMNAKADLNQKDANGDTALMYAVRALQGNMAQKLSDSGASLTAKNNAGDTPKKLAVRLGLISP